MKKYIALTLLCLISFASVSAQEEKNNAGGQNDVVLLKEYANATKSIDSLTKLTNSLKREKETIEKSLQDSTLKIARLTTKIDKLKTQIAAHKKSLEEGNFKKSELLKPYQDSLKLRDSIILSYKSQIEEQKKSAAERNSEIASLKKQLEDLHAFKRLYVKSKIEEKKPYLDLPYSQMDLAIINEVIGMCEELKSAELNDFHNNFTSARQRKNLYDSCVQSINSAYDETKINELLSQTTFLVESSNEAQQQEGTTLVEKMKSYSEAQRIFTTTVQWIAKFMNDYRTEDTDENTAKDAASHVFEFERIELWHEKFAQIPYLEKLFEQYKSHLIAEPTKAPQIELDTLK